MPDYSANQARDFAEYRDAYNQGICVCGHTLTEFSPHNHVTKVTSPEGDRWRVNATHYCADCTFLYFDLESGDLLVLRVDANAEPSNEWTAM